MLHQLIPLIPNDIYEVLHLPPQNTPIPSTPRPFHPRITWSPFHRAMDLTIPSLTSYFDRAALSQFFLSSLLSRVTQEWMPPLAIKHLEEFRVSYLILISLANSPEDISDWVKPPPPETHQRAVIDFLQIFLANLHNQIRNNPEEYRKLFLHTKDFFRLLFDVFNRRTVLYTTQLITSSLVQIPSHFPPLIRCRILILSRLRNDLLLDCLEYLSNNSTPKIQLFTKTRPFPPFRPEEWKSLTLQLPKSITGDGPVSLLAKFTQLLYNPSYKNRIPIGGGTGWNPPGHNICLLQLLTFLQPNWKELWGGLNWNLSLEMQKRLELLSSSPPPTPALSLIQILFYPP